LHEWFLLLSGVLFFTKFFSSQPSSFAFVVLLINSSYQLLYSDVHFWLMWIYWINTITYSFKSMLSSELRGVLFSCNGVNGVPSCSDYIAPAYRICILPGAKPSDSFILSNDYLAQQYEQYTSQIWIDFVAAVLFFVLFTSLTALCMEYVDLKQEGTITKLYKKDTSPQVESTEAQLKQEKTRQETSMNWKQYLTELLSLDTK